MFTDSVNTAIVSGLLSIASVIITLVLTHKLENMKTKDDKKIYPSLQSHPVHVNIDEHLRNARNIHIDNMNPGRVKLAKDFLTYAIECWREPCKAFAEAAQQCIDTCEIDCGQCNRIYTLAMTMFSNGRAYEQLTNWNIDLEDYDAVMIFKDKFIEWDSDRIQRLAKKISDISMINDTYSNCYLKAARILECIDDYIYDMYKDSMHTLGKLNGELTGKTYKCHVL